MASVNVPMLDPSVALVDREGRPTAYFTAWLDSIRDRTGGGTDKVETTHILAGAAVPQGTQVVASGGLRNGGDNGTLGGNIAITLYVRQDLLANLPTTGVREGDHAYALDGRKPGEGAGAGTGVPCIWSQSSWISSYSGVAATS